MVAALQTLDLSEVGSLGLGGDYFSTNVGPLRGPKLGFGGNCFSTNVGPLRGRKLGFGGAIVFLQTLDLSEVGEFWNDHSHSLIHSFAPFPRQNPITIRNPIRYAVEIIA
jgi:hypothetical protein